MRAEAWRLVVGYAQVLVFLLSCCFFITLKVPNRYEVRDFQLKSRGIGHGGGVRCDLKLPGRFDLGQPCAR
jgi:hypothetical protein